MYTVIVNGLNVRSAPSASADVKEVLNKGDQVAVIRIETAMDVRWGLTDTGWIVMDYVE